MSRPKPTIGSPNDHAAVFRQAQDFADRFAAHEGVVGVLLTGGVARGYADHFSEIDRRFGLRKAIQSPLFHLLRRETRGDEEWLVFDEERFRDYTEQDFEGFLHWDRALLRMLAEEGYR